MLSSHSFNYYYALETVRLYNAFIKSIGINIALKKDILIADRYRKK